MMPIARRYFAILLPRQPSALARQVAFVFVFCCFFPALLPLTARYPCFSFLLLIVILHLHSGHSHCCTISSTTEGYCIIGRVTGKVFIAISPSHSHYFLRRCSSVWAGFRFIFLSSCAWLGQCLRNGMGYTTPSVGTSRSKLYLIPLYHYHYHFAYKHVCHLACSLKLISAGLPIGLLF